MGIESFLSGQSMNLYLHFLPSLQSQCADTWKNEKGTNSEMEMDVVEIDSEDVNWLRFR
jgi:hypothetical protein